MFFVLLLLEACDDFSDQTYQEQQVPSGTNCTFTNCTFNGCAGSNGGALYFYVASALLALLRCLFRSCRASDWGGALYVYCLSVSMRETAGFNCSGGGTDSIGSFCYVLLASSAGATLVILESSVGSCTTPYTSTLSFWSLSSTYPSARVESLNTSANRASRGGSGLDVAYLNLSLRFCAFRGNTPASCLAFWSVLCHDFSCLSLLNNSCKSDSSWPGLIFVDSSTVALADCVFQANAFDYFLGTLAGYTGNVTLVHCVFDFESPNATNSVSFSLTNSLFLTGTTFLAECVTRSQSPSQTATRSQSPSQTATGSQSPSQTATRSQSPGLSRGAIAAIAAGAGIVVVAATVGGLFLFISRRRQREVPSALLDRLVPKT